MEMQQRILKYMRAGVPLLIWGPPGIGKTATVHALGKRLGIHVETLIASIHDPVDFSGWPVVQQGRVELHPQAWVHRLIEKGGILFLDEITNVPPAVQAALLRVILERVVGDIKLPDNVYILAAANPPELATDSQLLRPALANRLSHLQYQLDPLSWSEQFPTYWGDPPTLAQVDPACWQQARVIVAAFIRRRPDLLLNLPKNEEEMSYAWPSPRTWDAASRLMAICESVSDPNEWADEVVSCVGEAAGLEFINYARQLDLPDPEEILRDPSSFPIPEDSDKQFAIVQAVASAVYSMPNEERWNRYGDLLIRFATHQAEDIAAFGMRDFVRIYRKLLESHPGLKIPRRVTDALRDLCIRTGLIPNIAGGTS